MKNKRFIVCEDSAEHTCCYGYAIIDTKNAILETKPSPVKYNRIFAEFYFKETAEKVCDSLNESYKD